jgi:hypothetical protein
MAGLARESRLCYRLLDSRGRYAEKHYMRGEATDGWRVMTIDEAVLTREQQGRCIECHEPLRAHKTGTTGQAAHFEHLKSNPRCSLSGGVR